MTHASRKKASSWQRGTCVLSLSGSDQRFDNIVAFWCLGTTHTSLDVALVSPFHPVAALSRSALCWNIPDPQLNYKLTLTGLWKTSKRKLILMKARNAKCGHIHTWKRLTYFWHLKWGIQPFFMYSGKTPSSMEWLLNPVNKGKYKRNVFVSYLLLSFLLYNSFWDFLRQGVTPTNQCGGKKNNQNMGSDIQTATQPCPLPVTLGLIPHTYIHTLRNIQQTRVSDIHTRIHTGISTRLY